MGLNFNYLLYFKKQHLWDALQAVGDITGLQNSSGTTIHFPDREMKLPIRSDFGEKNELRYDAPEFNFATSLLFEEDEPVVEFTRSIGNDVTFRGPPDPDGINRISVGLIYLTVYADISQHWAFEKPLDLVLFQFGTTGTRMSLLFSESVSIRRTFTRLLEKVPGVCGVFDREIDGGELFWLYGQRLSNDLWDAFVPPDEIEKMLKRGF